MPVYPGARRVTPIPVLLNNSARYDRSSCCRHLLAELTLRQPQCGRLGRPSFLGNAPALVDSGWESRANSGESCSLGSGVSISSGNWGCGCNCGCTLPHIDNVSSI
jgi:hypothetical protein